MRTGLLVLLLTGVLLMSGCGPDDSGSEAAQERELKATRARVLDDLTAVLGDLTASLPARLRFTQGNYERCAGDLEGASGYVYSVNGRLDLDGAGGPRDLATVEETLRRAGFAVTSPVATSREGTRAGLAVRVSTVAGQPALLFSGGTDDCFEVGRDRAAAYSTERDPIRLG